MAKMQFIFRGDSVVLSWDPHQQWPGQICCEVGSSQQQGAVLGVTVAVWSLCG